MFYLNESIHGLDQKFLLKHDSPNKPRKAIRYLTQNFSIWTVKDKVDIW